MPYRPSFVNQPKICYWLEFAPQNSVTSVRFQFSTVSASRDDAKAR